MKPILLGMTNPHSKDPAHALWPAPVGSSGWRLFKMVADVSGASISTYADAFDRRNLFDLYGPDPRIAGPAFLKTLKPGRRVAVLGKAVWSALGIGDAPGPLGSVRGSNCTFTYVPHPSGRVLYYNDALHRWTVGRMLADMATLGEKRRAG